MKSPVCGKERITGGLIFKTPRPGALVPIRYGETDTKHMLKLLLGHKGTAAFSGEGKGWLCADRGKAVAIWTQRPKDKPRPDALARTEKKASCPVFRPDGMLLLFYSILGVEGFLTACGVCFLIFSQ